MRKMYEREWLGIEFTSYCRPSARSLADATFYDAFYRNFFQRYQSWDDLDPNWRNQKRAIARFIFDQLDSKDIVLSIGCGLGWIEHCLLDFSGGRIHLEATDVAAAAVNWIKEEIPSDRLHIGLFPQCLIPGLKYNLIYMSALDYCMDQFSLIGFLNRVADYLTTKGKCLLISASFDHPIPIGVRAIKAGKHIVASILEAVHLYHRGQFWGWTRTREDYHLAFSRAGYLTVRDGFINRDNGPPDYWIEGTAF